jgi:hypothetical protein
MGSTSPWWVDLVIIAASLIALAGQLALIRLALAPSITVGAAISHGLQRLPIYFLSALLIVFVLFAVAVPFAVALTAMGVALPTNGSPASPPVAIAALLYIALICFIGVRMLMSAAVATAEDVGPIAIIRRSWDLTAGNWWRLFGFLVMIFVAAIVLAFAVRVVTGVTAQVLLGPPEPMSASALVVAILLAALNSILTVLLALMLARIYVQLSGRGGVETSVPTTGH